MGKKDIRYKTLEELNDVFADIVNVLLFHGKRLNNTIFLMFLVTEKYKEYHQLSTEQFLELDSKYDILNYVSECPDIFDAMTEKEMVEEIDQYVAAA